MVIYGLLDKRARVKYVGKTVNIRIRLKSHRITNSWFKDYVILEEVTEETWVERERYWISYYGLENLMNVSKGGGGSVLGRKVSEESRLKMRNAHLGKTPSAETKRKMSVSTKNRKLKFGHHHSPEAIEKMRKARLNNPIKAMAGRKMSDEFKDKIKQSWIQRRINYGPTGGKKLFHT